jgi:hypothetical protein
MKKISTVFLMLISSSALYLSQPAIASPLNQTSMQTAYSSTDPEKKTKSDNKSKKGDDSNLSGNGNGNGYGHCKHHSNGVGNNGNNDGKGHDKYDGDCDDDDDTDDDTANVSLKTVEADPEELDPQELGIIWVTITGNKSQWDSTLLTIDGNSYCYAHSSYSSKTLGFQYYAPSSTGTY